MIRCAAAAALEPENKTKLINLGLASSGHKPLNGARIQHWSDRPFSAHQFDEN